MAKMVFKMAPRMKLEVFEDGGLLLNLPDLSLTELNPTACEILQGADGSKSIESVAQVLALAYGIPVETALHDAVELFQQLHQGGMVEEVDPMGEKGS